MTADDFKSKDALAPANKSFLALTINALPHGGYVIRGVSERGFEPEPLFACAAMSDALNWIREHMPNNGPGSF